MVGKHWASLHFAQFDSIMYLTEDKSSVFPLLWIGGVTCWVMPNAAIVSLRAHSHRAFAFAFAFAMPFHFYCFQLYYSH